MNAGYPLVVIGGGPAGIAAAVRAARHGVRVALLDDQPQAGGQIYLNLESSALDPSILGPDYSKGASLLASLRESGVEYFPQTSVWYLDRDRQLGLIQQGRAQRIAAQHVVIACGAQERPMPFPGWDKPGVLTAGGAQTLLKSSAMLAEDGVVLAGRGPLLLLLAQQYLRAGVRLGAILDTTAAGAWHRTLKHIPRTLLAIDYLFKGWRMIRAIRKAGVPWYRQVDALRAEGGERLQGVGFRSLGRSHRIDTDLLLTHDGVIPEIQVAQAAGCAVDWSDSQQCWHARVDAWSESSRANIFVTGDAAGIGGADAARLGGELAGLQVAHRLGFLTSGERDKMARPLRRQRHRHLAIRPFLDAWYAPAQAERVDDDTLVCRCEGVDAAEIRNVIALGCPGPNQAKAFTRCGMGACQGRFCASTVERLFAQQLGLSPGKIGRYHARPPLKPVTLGQLAGHEEIES